MTMSSAHLRQITLAMGLVLGAAGCSTISDLDPTGLLSDSSDNAPASQFPDQAAPTASDTDAGTTPDLASLPARPAPTATPGDRQQATQSLASDGAQARYSGDALRGGTEAAAPPPAASDSAPSIAQRVLGSQDAPPTASDAPPTASDAPPTAAPVPAPQIAAAPPPAAAPPAPASPPAASLPPQMPAGAQPAVAATAPVQTAALPGAPVASPVGPSASAPAAAPSAASGAQPAVPANAPARGAAMMAQPTASDAALGFRPSAAPPLDPSVSQFVSAPIVAQYRQTASNSVTVNAGAVPAVPAVPAKGTRASSDDGSVVANLDTVAGSRIAMMNGGVTPTAVVYFAGDGVKLSKAAHAQIRAAVAAFKASGGRATVRVIGHASSRTGNMSVERHMETIFAKSQARASAVARDLIHQGVPADKVLIDAVGDSQPVYFESMPKGEEGNRRAEIFVQS
jgi:outer membrane protein OmpA-like peptidoglycan-associated protein